MKFLQAFLPLAVAFVVTPASAQFSTSFELPTYTSGTISGQDSWVSANPTNARVLTAAEITAELLAAGFTPGQTVQSGSQAFMASGVGSSSSSFGPIGGLTSISNIVLDVWTRPLIGGTTGNVFLTMEDAAGDRAAAFRFGPNLSIDVGSTNTGIWRPTGLQWTSNTWYHLTMTVDYASKTYDFAVNGTTINTNPIAFYTALSDNFAQVRVFRGANQPGMLVDDLTVVAVPEPGTLGLLALGLLAVIWKSLRR